MIRPDSRRTVTICDGAVIQGPVSLRGTNLLSVSCAGFNCTIESDGTDSCLYGAGESVGIYGITFRNGVAQEHSKRNSYRYGGNVRISAPGRHRVVNCTFVGGNATDGGNLHVRATGSPFWSGVHSDNAVTIVNSTFVGGIGGNLDVSATKSDGKGASVQISGSEFIDSVGKGGAIVSATGSANITNCRFEANKGGQYGGGLTVVAGGPLPSVIQENIFTSNEGEEAGGLSVPTWMGSLPSLHVLNNVFEDNAAIIPYWSGKEWSGGAAYIAEGIIKEALVSGNQGSGNSNDNGPCADISLRLRGDINNPICVSTDVDFSTGTS